MKTNSILNRIKSYLKELTIVTLGVLVALVISNYKENYQAKKYHMASMETVKNEIELNYDVLKNIIESHTSLQDTIRKYSKDSVLISDLIYKEGGLQGIYLRNTGLDFYSKNHIHLIDFEMMSMLLNMRSTSELIDIKLEKLLDYLYPNLFDDSKESKMLVSMYLGNLVNSEAKLLRSYEDFIEKYMNTERNRK